MCRGEGGVGAEDFGRQMDLKALSSPVKGEKFRHRRSRMQACFVRISTSVLLWACAIQLTALLELWGPRLLRTWPGCFGPLQNSPYPAEFSNVLPSVVAPPERKIVLPPKTHWRDVRRAWRLLVAMRCTYGMLGGRVGNVVLNCWLLKLKFFLLMRLKPIALNADKIQLTFHSTAKIVDHQKGVYKNNGYLIISCNGGLNQMRAAICDMVAIARLLNVTLVVPELDKASFWADPSEFKDIFDVDHFITSLRDEVRIIKQLPSKFKRKAQHGMIFSMPPVSWSNISYYLHQILPLIRKHKVLHLTKTDARLANNGLPIELQRLRCRVNYSALRFTSQIEDLGQRLLKILQRNGPFLVLHLRYEMDMLAFSGCTHGCTDEEADELTRMRYAYPWWKEKVINSELKRKDGLCPLTPEETALILQAFDFDRNLQIYIAAGEIYGGERRMSSLQSAYPNIVRKEMLLNSQDLNPFQNHSSQMAALDYLVSLASDTFFPTYDGNMAKVVEGHRRFLGFRKTILLERKLLVELLDQHRDGSLPWDEFALAVKESHAGRMGAPTIRTVIPDRPKEEDYFYANPQECLKEPFDGEFRSF